MKPDNSKRQIAFDGMRLLALLLVTSQHIASVAGREPSRIIFSLDVGQVGVAMFLALSGFFNKVDTQEKIADWTKRRLLRILIPYWIVLIPIMSANWIVGYKPMTWDLALSHAFAVTPFTHPGHLVGVHLWFISLLLTCDLLSLLVRLRKNLIFPIAALSLMWATYDSHLGSHATAYFLGVACRIGFIYRRPTYLIILTVVLSMLAVFWPNELASSVVATATLAFGLISLPNQMRFHQVWKWIATRSYHYYLVHGPIYLAVAQFYSSDLAMVLFIGLPISLISAELLAMSERVLVLPIANDDSLNKRSQHNDFNSEQVIPPETNT